MSLTYDQVMRGRTTRRNFSKRECAAWGIDYPPPLGFPNRLYPQTEEGVCLIPCSRGFVARVDPEDYDLVADSIWVSANGARPGRADYFQPVKNIIIDGRRSALSMGRTIMPPPEGLQIDHINGDPFDNRRANLRHCTADENKRNRRAFVNGVSGFKGVLRHGNLWRAVIHIDKRRIDLGGFRTEAAAAAAYDAAAAKLHGDFAKLNFGEAA